jgi:hypothetical protein
MASSTLLAKCSVLVLGILVSVGLQGCGGGGGTTTTTTKPTTTGTSTTTTATTYTTPSPDDREQATVNELNKNYMNYGQNAESTGPFGVTIRFLHPDVQSMTKWFFCGTPCYKGYADCRVSSAILNHQVMVKDRHIEKVLSMPIGVVFNQTTVENKLAKCSYAYDGGTDLRYNYGCGCGTSDQNCSSPQCAYASIDPKTGKPMTETSIDISRCHCKNVDDHGCYWKGPAFFPDGGANEFPQMMEQRVKAQQAGTQKLDWDEVIIDGKVLTKLLEQDASSAISGFVWVKTGDQSTDSQSFGYAKELFKIFNEMYAFRSAPIIALDMQQDVTQGGPFQVSSRADRPYFV